MQEYSFSPKALNHHFESTLEALTGGEQFLRRHFVGVHFVGEHFAGVHFAGEHFAGEHFSVEDFD